MLNRAAPHDFAVRSTCIAVPEPPASTESPDPKLAVLGTKGPHVKTTISRVLFVVAPVFLAADLPFLPHKAAGTNRHSFTLATDLPFLPHKAAGDENRHSFTLATTFRFPAAQGGRGRLFDCQNSVGASFPGFYAADPADASSLANRVVNPSAGTTVSNRRADYLSLHRVKLGLDDPNDFRDHNGFPL